jgi:hypothetical protein
MMGFVEHDVPQRGQVGRPLKDQRMVGDDDVGLMREAGAVEEVARLVVGSS